MAATFALCGGVAFAQGTAVAPALPVGGHVPQPPQSTHLREKVWEPAAGYPLYVLNRECNGQCAVTFPPLTPALNAKPPSREWTIRVREENGALQWAYKGKPVYTFSGDKPTEPPKADQIIPGVALAQK